MIFIASLKKHSLIVSCVLFFISFAGLGEVGSRIIVNQDALDPFAAFGYSPASRQFKNFKKFVRSEGVPDCVFLGNSLVQVGIDPHNVEQSFQRTTGNSITCYNFGMDGSTMSSTALVALVLAKEYKPAYIILGVQANQFFASTGNNAHLAENQLKESLYFPSRFNLEGQLRKDSVFYQTLEMVLPKLFPNHELDEYVKEQSEERTRPEVSRKTNDNGYAPLVSYRDESPLFYQPVNGLYHNSLLDTEDFEALGSLIGELQDHTSQLMLVEMPINDPSPLVTSTISEVAAYSRERGIPFLSTQGLAPLPATAYADQIHLHISGSAMFSAWLGEQLGQIIMDSAWEDVNAAVWSPTTDMWSEPHYFSTLGLSERDYADYLTIAADSDPFSEDVIVFAPSEDEWEPIFLQSLIGFEIGWEKGLTDQERENLFQLMVVLGHVKFQNDLHLSSADSALLAQWKINFEPSLLKDLGIQFVLCRETLADPSIVHCPEGIAENSDYEAVSSWPYRPLYEHYRLYRIASN